VSEIRTYPLSPKVRVKIGYDNADMIVEVKVPIIGWTPLTIEAHELDMALDTITKAVEHRGRVMARKQDRWSHDPRAM